MAIKAETGKSISATEARDLHRLSLERDRSQEVARKLDELGLAKMLSVATFQNLAEKVSHWRDLAREAAQEGIEAARRLKVPVVMHNSPETQGLVIEVAKVIGDKLVAAHCNFRFDAESAVAQATRLQKLGALIDVHTGDMFGLKFFVESPEVTYALFANDLVDMISTDYIGGYWDPILLTLERVIEAEHVKLPKAIAMATSQVVKAFPKLAPDRGLVEPGKVADLVIVDREHIGRVHAVIIGGKVVVERAEDPGLHILT